MLVTYCERDRGVGVDTASERGRGVGVDIASEIASDNF